MMMTLRRFFFARGLPFAAVEDPWLAQYTKAAIAFGRAGGRMATPEELADTHFSPTPGLVFALPRRQALAGKHLDEEMEIAEEYAKTHRLGPDGVDKAGVSCTSDGADINGKPTYNICFVSRHGPIYAGVYDLDVKGAYTRAPPSLSLWLSLTISRPPSFLFLRYEEREVHGGVAPHTARERRHALQHRGHCHDRSRRCVPLVVCSYP
jgi:hypothetical protein